VYYLGERGRKSGKAEGGKGGEIGDKSFTGKKKGGANWDLKISVLLSQKKGIHGGEKLRKGPPARTRGQVKSSARGRSQDQDTATPKRKGGQGFKEENLSSIVGGGGNIVDASP